jgi:hypothetical protein
MRGDLLLLLHLALLDEREGGGERPSAAQRLEAALGPGLARTLLTALVGR